MIEANVRHVVKRWPERRRRIDDLLATNKGFREVCQDYEELAEWVEERKDSVVGGFETAVELLESLAIEITSFLTTDEETGRR